MEPTNSPQLHVKPNSSKCRKSNGLGRKRPFWKLWVLLLTFYMAFCIKTYAQTELAAGPAAGSKQFKALIANEMVYPPLAKAKGIEQTIVLKYRIEVDGTATFLRTIDGNDSSLIIEAKRLINRVIWNPAQTKNQKTPSELDIEIDFNLKKYARMVKRRGYELFTADYEVDTSCKVFVMRELEKAALPDFGGPKNLAAYIEKNLAYPEYARKQGIAGIVRVKFIIEPSGATTNYIVTEHVPMGCTEEAIRVLEAIKWRPAFAGGKAVRSWNSASIRFGDAGNDFKFQPANQFNSAF
jgi:outer membrane biosynthesis protein TonB